MYLTYDEYADYGGAVKNETAFERYEYKARSYIDTMTFNRLKDMRITEPVKRCMFELIETIRAVAEMPAVGISSMNNDGVSVSFAADHEKAYRQRIAAVIGEYLGEQTTEDGTYLVYRGVI